ncbi:MAG: glycoside hydrolase family 95 protein [Lentisphaerae bacterium]|nr:glycoside hydrolase family 95 protein [Lentisphaerota bacterium]
MQTSTHSSPVRLWYRVHAWNWHHALPLGNGRLGAMVFGRVARERIQINEESLWEGTRIDRSNPLAGQALPQIRALLFSGRNQEAYDLAEKSLLSPERNIDPYQSAGELVIDWVGGGARPSHESNFFNPAPGGAWWQTAYATYDYERALDLSTGMATTTLRYRGVRQQREHFCSAPDQLICTRIAFDPGRGDVDINLQREQDVQSRVATPDGHLLLTGRLTRGGMRFALLLQARVTGGRLIADEDCLRVRGADAVELRLAVATSYVAPGDLSADAVGRCRAVMTAASGKSWEQLRADHIAAHRQLFDRVRLELPASPGDALPTDERLARVKKGEEDPGLEALYFHYGRYLIMSASRPGSLPANLQGVWAHQMSPSWDSDYHTNINMQMNYWLTGPTNLIECQEPLFYWMSLIAPAGHEAARKLYGCDGWVAHHVCDVHGCVEPMDGACGIWPMGSIWLATHCLEHYRFSGDRKLLADRLWPLMRGAVTFACDFLVEAPAGTPCAGKLVTSPSHSPENTFVAADGSHSMFTYGATMDLALIAQLIDDCLEVLALLDLDEPAFAARLRTVKANLAPVKVSPRLGIVQEWIEDYEECEPGHRHISSLIGLHPLTQITRGRTPALFDAARATVTRRLAHGGGHTGWSKAWLINFLARLGDGAAAHTHILGLLREKTLPNLFDDHPPFQIDGNFGATAGMAELLLQSHDGLIDLLPALPPAWSCGAVTGLRARGGVTVDLRWQDRRLIAATLTADHSGSYRVRLPDGTLREIQLQAATKTELPVV